MKIRRGDTVEIRTGKDAGKRGKVLTVDPGAGRLVVEGLNLRKKHARPRRLGEKGQIVEFPASLPVSRASFVCPHCQKAIRVGFRFTSSGQKERWCRKCGAAIAAV